MSAALIADRRFWPLFWTQLLGAFNDNLFKNSLVLLITFTGVKVGGLPPEQMVALSAAVFILPFFLFSATAGQLADKLDKARVIRATKSAEIVVMALGALGLYLQAIPLLLGVLFLMGLQSAFFGPCKYSYLPVHLRDGELVAGNAFVELGTYLGILGGTLVGGVLIALDGGAAFVAVGVLTVAVGGRLLSNFLLPAEPGSPDLVVNLCPVGPTRELFRVARRDRTVWLSMMGVGWFWAFGSAFLSLFPTYVKQTLNGNEGIATMFLALFSVGIGVGSLLCERLSRDRLELGLVPLGSFGMSLFSFDLLFAAGGLVSGPEPLGVRELMVQAAGWRIAGDLALLAVFGGFLIVPLYTLIQQRAEPALRSRTIAASNVLNAAFMVGGSVVLMLLLGRGLSAPEIFGVLAVVNAVVAIYIYTVIPEFLLRFVAWMLANVVYRMEVRGHELVPKEGPCVVVCNHVSFIDWLIVAAALKRPGRFVMAKVYHQLPLVRVLFRQAKTIPIASRKEDPEALDRAMDRISEELRDGQLVCIFPEGRITHTGELLPFKPGIERIIARDPVPVVPMALNGLWGSYFSRVDGKAMSKPFRRVWSRIHLTIGEPVTPDDMTAAGLEETVGAMWGAEPDRP